MQFTLHINDSTGSEISTVVSMRVGAVYKMQANLKILAQDLAATVSSCAWSTDSSVVTLGTPALASSISTCNVTAAYEGDTTVKLIVTMSDAQILVYRIRFVVEE